MGKGVPVRTKLKLREAANEHMTMLAQTLSALCVTLKIASFAMRLNTSQGRSDRRAR